MWDQSVALETFGIERDLFHAGVLGGHSVAHRGDAYRDQPRLVWYLQMMALHFRISDAEFHELILCGISPEGEAHITEISKEYARRAGLSEEEIEKLYG